MKQFYTFTIIGLKYGIFKKQVNDEQADHHYWLKHQAMTKASGTKPSAYRSEILFWSINAPFRWL